MYLMVLSDGVQWYGIVGSALFGTCIITIANAVVLSGTVVWNGIDSCGTV